MRFKIGDKVEIISCGYAYSLSANIDSITEFIRRYKPINVRIRENYKYKYPIYIRSGYGTSTSLDKQDLSWRVRLVIQHEDLMYLITSNKNHLLIMDGKGIKLKENGEI